MKTKPMRRKQKENIPAPRSTPALTRAECDAGSPFPIEGVCASAGGLEALELFLANVHKDSGRAFVIVPHLDPTQVGILVELLRRGTTMQVL